VREENREHYIYGERGAGKDRRDNLYIIREGGERSPNSKAELDPTEDPTSAKQPHHRTQNPNERERVYIWFV
jgi:hypothetical protein